MRDSVKTQVVLPRALLGEMDKVVPSRKRSEFITEILEKELKRLRLREALHEAAGSWSEKDYPHLKTREDINRYVRTMRENFFVRDRPRKIRKRA